MGRRATSILIGIIILLLIAPILFGAISFTADIYPKSKAVYLQKPMTSSFRQEQGIQRRECKRIQWSFVAIADYDPDGLLQLYKEKWKSEPGPVPFPLEKAEHRSNFFPIFSLVISNFEFSMEKQLGYTTQSIPLKEYAVVTYLNICKLSYR